MVTYCPKCHHEMEVCFSGSGSVFMRCRNEACGANFRVLELLIVDLAGSGDYMVKVDN